MLSLLGWLIYGIIVGYFAKLFHPGEDPVGIVPTLGIGVAGSYIGGLLNWILGMGGSPISASGIIMGTIGGVICCMVYRQIKIQQFIKIQGRSPRMFISKNDQK